MPIIAGIDEAGYGPTLGPLVVTSTIFQIPETKNSDIWELLKDSVSKKKSRDNEYLVIDDSKKLYSKSKGLGKLEEPLLSFIFNLKGRVNSFKNLVQNISEINGEEYADYPWYYNKDLLIPVDVEDQKILMASSKLSDCLEKADVKFLDIKSVPVYVAKFNSEVIETGNKSVLLFKKCANLITDIWCKFGEMSPVIYVDRHGGRKRYLPLLYPYFDGCIAKIHKETNSESIYEIIDDKKKMLIHFVQKAETKHFPVALSSMCSKYIRECFLMMFNLYWQEKQPGLKGTAGYYLDARRFLSDISKTKNKLNIKNKILIRQK